MVNCRSGQIPEIADGDEIVVLHPFKSIRKFARPR